MQNNKISDWLNDLSSKTPTPGGGAVAALCVAISAAQLQMVAEFTTGVKWQDVETHMKAICDDLVDIRSLAMKLVDADTAAFIAVGDAFKMPKDSESANSARQKAIQTALTNATKPPTDTSQLAMKLVEIALELADNGNPNVISDVAVGASLAKSALESAIVNIEINMHSISDTITKKRLVTAVEEATDAVQDADGIIETVRDKMSKT